MSRNRRLSGRPVYFVEGVGERNLVRDLQREGYIAPGLIHVHNAVNNRLNRVYAATVKSNDIVVLVFDTENHLKPEILLANLEALKPLCKNVLLIPQCPNLEAEIRCCTGVNSVRELVPERTVSDFKSRFCDEHLKLGAFISMLLNHGFRIDLLWSRTPSEPFHFIKSNDSHKIKLK